MGVYVTGDAEAAQGKPDEPPPLTHAGCGQARALARRLPSKAAVGAALASRLFRASETTQIVATAARVGHQADCAPVTVDLAGEAKTTCPRARVFVVELPD